MPFNRVRPEDDNTDTTTAQKILNSKGYTAITVTFDPKLNLWVSTATYKKKKITGKGSTKLFSLGALISA